MAVDAVGSDLREVLSAGYLPPAVRPAASGAQTTGPTPPSPFEDPEQQGDHAWRGSEDGPTLAPRRASHLFRPNSARREPVLDRELKVLAKRGLAHSRTVAVGSIGYRAGGDALTLLLAEALKRTFGCGVLIVALAPPPGGRSAADGWPVSSAPDDQLLALLDGADPTAALRRCLINLPSGAQLLAQAPTVFDQLDGEMFGNLLFKLQRTYPLVLLDHALDEENAAGIEAPEIELADTVLAVTSADMAGLRRAQTVLVKLSKSRRSAQRALLVNQVPTSNLRAVQRVIDRSRRRPDLDAIYRALPTDRALSLYRSGTELTLSGLESSTRVAVKELTLALAQAWVR